MDDSENTGASQDDYPSRQELWHAKWTCIYFSALFALGAGAMVVTTLQAGQFGMQQLAMMGGMTCLCLFVMARTIRLAYLCDIDDLPEWVEPPPRGNMVLMMIASTLAIVGGLSEIWNGNIIGVFLFVPGVLLLRAPFMHSSGECTPLGA